MKSCFWIITRNGAVLIELYNEMKLSARNGAVLIEVENFYQGIRLSTN